MKYQFDAIISGEEKINKTFKNRSKLDKYLERVIERYNLVIEDVVNYHNENVEYICDDFNRISINRI